MSGSDYNRTGSVIDELSIPYRTKFQLVFEPFLAVFILFFAALGNSLMIFIIYKNKTLRTIPNAFVLNLCMGDLLLAITIMPLFFWTLLQGKWTFSEVTCIIQGYLNYFFFSLTLITLTTISINRFLLVAYPKKYRVIFTRRSVCAVILSIWLFCAVYSSIPLLGLGLGQFLFNRNTAMCTSGGEAKPFRISSQVSMTMLMVTMITCNTRLVKEVRQHRKRINFNATNESSTNEAGNGPTGSHGKEIQISRTIVFVVGTFCIGWLPTYIMDISETIGWRPPRLARVAGIFTILMDSMANPFLFGLTNRKFRLAMSESFIDQCCKRKTWGTGAAGPTDRTKVTYTAATCHVKKINVAMANV